ncbi:MAG: NAD-dependent epimerase/dehydratase family protein [Candidatus Aminicenantes bacterium]|nr:NAD-dependent epimerase/dehydratase family protein [Candidatus Aminicenantes bacterium]NIM84168.1 NAD-dependent epimerase/dehydratase family protein [Candidatus Aminicenantes bacterium]NIN23615.1 NAD-dependent epimerase/dehydratase family protein [Candidatus Aminicenantes bacterium]NIN47322.1 NAD-dependent epimerase/dehydratase family protein [Candidatus Aminicenantes bacterium]NIN90251.1 NAD-dependent epimerase/dehydratase family protein [Candidatus Aminicenantes bacterium]
MKALVTGSTGFIGSHLVESLIKKKYKVYCLIRKESDLRWIENLEVELISGSYWDKESLCHAVKGMDYVFHVGAVITAFEWETYYKVNVEGTINLLEACAEVNPGLKKFVFVSSISAAGPAKDKRPLKESDPCHPVSLYGKSKCLAEEAAARFFDQLPIVIIRPTNVFGIRQKQLYTTLKLAKKRIIPLLGNGDKQTSICFVQDVVKALILAAENEKVRGKTFFVANPGPYSWREILKFITTALGLPFIIKIPHQALMIIAFVCEMIAKLAGGRPLITRKTIRSTRENYWLHDISSIRRELGFSPEVPFEEGMRDIIKWYKDNGLL